jgi:hypothetical protein
MKYDSEFIDSLNFWPEDVVREAFADADQAIGTGGEALALRVFYLRMKHHLKTAEAVDGNPDDEFRMIEEYERPWLEAEFARIEGRVLVACEGCTLHGPCKQEGTHEA